MLSEQTNKLLLGKITAKHISDKILVSKIYAKKLLKLSNKKKLNFKNGQKSEPHQRHLDSK